MNTAKKTEALADEPSSPKRLMPAAPEAGNTHAKKRKRLAKAFKRPLDKELRSVQLVRDKYVLPAEEYQRLLEVKKRLADQGLPVKKGELVRAGLILLAALEDGDLKDVVLTVPSVAD